MNKIEKKAAQLQKELEAWAKDNNVLNAGERLVFTLEVEKVATVERHRSKTPEEVLSMLASQFFSETNLARLGVPKAQIRGRIIRMMGYEIEYLQKEKSRENISLGELLERLPTQGKIMRLRNMGLKCAENIAMALAAHGVHLP